MSRLVAVLESRGYVEQVSERGKYRLGFSVARLARALSGQLDLVKLSQDVCDSLAAEVGETTNLAILDADRIVNIVEAIGPAEITLRTWVGQSCPARMRRRAARCCSRDWTRPTCGYGWTRCSNRSP